MNRSLKNLLVACLATVSAASFAQDNSTSQVDQSSQTTITPGTSRSETGAIVSILSRLTPDEGRVVVEALNNLDQHNAAGGHAMRFATRNEGKRGTLPLFLNAVDGQDQQTLRDAWHHMGSFDHESVLILARAAYFGGLDGGPNASESERPLRFFTDGNQNWSNGGAAANTTTPGAASVDSNGAATAAGTMTPVGTYQVPEWNIVDTLAGKLGAEGDAFRAAIQKINGEGSGQTARTLSFRSAQQVLMDAMDSSQRDAFMQAWNGLDYDDQEAAATIVRDAYFGGINDL